MRLWGGFGREERDIEVGIKSCVRYETYGIDNVGVGMGWFNSMGSNVGALAAKGHLRQTTIGGRKHLHLQA